MWWVSVMCGACTLSHQSGAWRVTVLLNSTAAFFFFFFGQIWDISSVAQCTMGVMLLYGSQPVTEGGEKAPLQCDWLLCKQQYRMVIVAFWTRQVLICLINYGWWFSWRTAAAAWSTYACMFTMIFSPSAYKSIQWSLELTLLWQSDEPDVQKLEDCQLGSLASPKIDRSS